MPSHKLKAWSLLGLITLKTDAIVKKETNTASLTVPATTPQDASAGVSPDFPGFAFEEASFVRYAQDDSKQPNQFSINLIQSILSRTGGNPIIRIGGTSGDYAKYVPSQVEPALPVAEQNTGIAIGNTTIGPSFWSLCKNIPNARYIVQVPMATTNISETVAWVSIAVQGIGIDNIQSIEIGNEPNFYGTNPNVPPNLGPPNYQGVMTGKEYVSNFTKYTSAITKAVALPQQIFQAFDTGSMAGTQDATVYNVQNVFNWGINKGQNINAVAHHYYQAFHGDAGDLAAGLMNHSAIAARLNLYKPFVSFLRTNQSNLPFVISEAANSLLGERNYSYSASFATALWQVDFQLYSMTVGVSRINFQSLMAAAFSLWLPEASGNLKAQVFPGFYAQPFIADFIGNTGGKTQVAYLPIQGVKTDVIAYGAYVNNAPARVAIVNLNFWTGTPTDQRPSATITLDLPATVSSVRLDRLSNLLGAYAGAPNTTYAGSQWTFASNGKEARGVRNDSSTLQVHGGTVEVAVKDSEAILLHL